jgi:DNA-binding transcriptional MerR regulator
MNQTEFPFTPLMVAETIQSYNFVVREINKLLEEINKSFEEKKKLREKEDAKIIEAVEEKISALNEKLFSFSILRSFFLSLQEEQSSNALTAHHEKNLLSGLRRFRASRRVRFRWRHYHWIFPFVFF